jgi:hypothetical protein
VRKGRLGAKVRGRCGAGEGQIGRVEWKEGLTSASKAAMYFTSPISETLRFTSSVNATGEKTARAPDWRRTGAVVSKSI